MCDLRWLDPSQDPSDREPYKCYLGDPRVVNDGPVGLARFTTARSWLSQWSYDLSAANGLTNGAGVSVPALVLNNTADLACTPSHAQRLFAALGSKDKVYHDVKDADHYYMARPDLLPLAVELLQGWMAERGF
jgi:alpha-beta hydrolase superfamily lysophospholipase